MPAFATVQDVADEYGTEYLAELAAGASEFDPADAEDPVTVKVQRQLDRFGAKLDGAVRARYGDAHGYDETNALLNGMNAQGAFLYVMEKGRGGLDDKAEKSLERLVKDVDRISAGTLTLETDAEPAPEPGAPSDDWFRGRDRVFARPYRQEGVTA